MLFVIYILNSEVVNSIMNKINIYSCILQLPQFSSEVVEASIVNYRSVVPNSVGAGVSSIIGLFFTFFNITCIKIQDITSTEDRKNIQYTVLASITSDENWGN